MQSQDEGQKNLSVPQQQQQEGHAKSTVGATTTRANGNGGDNENDDRQYFAIRTHSSSSSVMGPGSIHFTAEGAQQVLQRNRGATCQSFSSLAYAEAWIFRRQPPQPPQPPLQSVQESYTLHQRNQTGSDRLQGNNNVVDTSTSTFPQLAQQSQHTAIFNHSTLPPPTLFHPFGQVENNNNNRQSQNNNRQTKGIRWKNDQKWYVTFCELKKFTETAADGNPNLALDVTNYRRQDLAHWLTFHIKDVYPKWCKGEMKENSKHNPVDWQWRFFQLLQLGVRFDINNNKNNNYHSLSKWQQGFEDWKAFQKEHPNMDLSRVVCQNESATSSKGQEEGTAVKIKGDKKNDGENLKNVDERTKRVALWEQKQLQEFEKNNEGDLTNEMYIHRYRLLQEVNFPFPKKPKKKNGQMPRLSWEQRLQQFIKFKADHGHPFVSPHHPGGLGGWCKQQRRKYRIKQEADEDEEAEVSNGMTLSDDQLKQLQDAGFSFEGIQAKRARESSEKGVEEGMPNSSNHLPKKKRMKFPERLQQFKDYLAQHDGKMPPQSKKGVGEFIHDMRRQYAKYLRGKPSSMTAERYHELIQAGFDFTPKGQRQQDKIHQSRLQYFLPPPPPPHPHDTTATVPNVTAKPFSNADRTSRIDTTVPPTTTVAAVNRDNSNLNNFVTMNNPSVKNNSINNDNGMTNIMYSQHHQPSRAGPSTGLTENLHNTLSQISHVNPATAAAAAAAVAPILTLWNQQQQQQQQNGVGNRQSNWF